MPIKAGWNILRFVRVEESKGKKIGPTVYDAFKFFAVNLITEEIEFVFLCPVGHKQASIVRDLFFCNHTKQWMDVRLVEKKRVLAIAEMKEVKNSEAELAVIKQRMRGRIQ